MDAAPQRSRHGGTQRALHVRSTLLWPHLRANTRLLHEQALGFLSASIRPASTARRTRNPDRSIDPLARWCCLLACLGRHACAAPTARREKQQEGRRAFCFVANELCMNSLYTVGTRTLAGIVGWQVVVEGLRVNKLPHELFVLAHHVTLSLMSSFYVGRAVRAHLSGKGVQAASAGNTDPVQELLPTVGASAGNTDPVHQELLPTVGAPGDKPTETIPYVFLGYLAADVLNRHRLKRPFRKLDFVHHTMGAAYVSSLLFITPANSLDAALVGIQELSSILLTLMDLGYGHILVKALFAFTFILTRVGLGGAVAAQRIRLYLRGGCPLLLTLFWCSQLCLNSVFTVLILRKFLKLFKSR